MEKKWEEMSADEKQEAMFQRWLSPQDIEFVSPEAERLYKERITRIKDARQGAGHPTSEHVPFY